VNRNGARLPLAPLPRPRAAIPASAPELITYPRLPESELQEQFPASHHFHWVVQAFSKADDEGRLYDLVTITVEGPDEQAALYRAMQVVPRNLYRVLSVAESCTLDEALR
jgi:hypothetical protein